jgi:isoleucyl-tRNA synthetase
VDDFNSWRQRHDNEEILNPVQGNGVYAEPAVLRRPVRLEGQPGHRREAARSRLPVRHEEITHSYMHCWRHKTPLIYRATSQWFVGMDIASPTGRHLRELGARCRRGDEVLPGLGPGAAARDDRQPSRLVHLAPAQLGRADSLLPAQGNGRAASAHAELMEQVAQRVEKEGIEAWFKLDPPNCWAPKQRQYDKISDTLDVWFDSGTTHWQRAARLAQ